MTIDLVAGYVEALRSPAGREALAEALRPVMAETVRAELARATDGLLDDRAAAAHLGLNAPAFRARARRDPNLRALALGGERFRRWRRGDLDGYMSARSKPRPLRAGDGGAR